jgi:ABC-type multidrug transport system fused ATPase/permease subunit
LGTAQSDYERNKEKLEDSISKGEALSKKLSMGRLATALPGLLLAIAGFSEPQLPSLVWQFGLLLIVAFLALASWQEVLRDQLNWSIQKRNFYRRMQARCTRDWSGLPALPTEQAAVGYANELSKDLDLFGDRSLFRWFSLAVTESGAKTIAEWMGNWSAFSAIADRQQAVEELAHQRVWRESFWDAALGFRGCDTSPERIAAWGKSPGLFDDRAWLRPLTWIGPIGVLIAIAVMIAGVLTARASVFSFGFFAFLAAVTINLLVTVSIIGRIHDLFVQIGNANRELSSLNELFGLVEKLEPESILLVELRKRFFVGEIPATDAIANLQRRMRWAGIQRNPLLFIPYWFVQLTLFWDARVLESLEAWKVRHGTKVQAWIEGLGQIEALVSGAAVSDEYPHWKYPKCNDVSSRDLSVTELGHPLIPDTHRVLNDVHISESHPLLLVTGSNMAGKSTLLRSLGINTVLGRLGSRVACSSWVGPNCALASSIRVQDSLADGVSFFMAELKRLRSITDATREHQSSGGNRVSLVLLDEILQGTNSRERQIAVEQVLDQFVQLGALVVASTHDLELANCPGIARVAQVVHFREYFESIDGVEQMRFDYKMRAGVTPTTNALKLLEMVGLSKRSQKP